MTLLETGLMALIPLFIGFAIDGLLAGNTTELLRLAGLMAVLIVVAVLRRIYDTRAYGTIRVELGKAQATRSHDIPVSTLNACLGMERELVDFLEETLPAAMAASVQLVISVIILYAFSPTLALAGGIAALGMAAVYAMFLKNYFLRAIPLLTRARCYPFAVDQARLGRDEAKRLFCKKKPPKTGRPAAP